MSSETLWHRERKKTRRKEIEKALQSNTMPPKKHPGCGTEEVKMAQVTTMDETQTPVRLRDFLAPNG